MNKLVLALIALTCFAAPQIYATDNTSQAAQEESKSTQEEGKTEQDPGAHYPTLWLSVVPNTAVPFKELREDIRKDLLAATNNIPAESTLCMQVSYKDCRDAEKNASPWYLPVDMINKAEGSLITYKDGTIVQLDQGGYKGYKTVQEALAAVVTK